MIFLLLFQYLFTNSSQKEQHLRRVPLGSWAAARKRPLFIRNRLQPAPGDRPSHRPLLHTVAKAPPSPTEKRRRSCLN
ncbi:hypothetical protein FALCPG4_002037 [Fusarium falciforme]